MDRLDRILENFTNPATGSLHGAAFIVVNRSGQTIYKRAAGKLNIGSESASSMKTDSLCWIASMTKVITAVAVLQLVERGLVSLDDDVRDFVPELADVCVLRGFQMPAKAMDAAKGLEEDTSLPIMEDVVGKISIRDLLCHTSGFVYDGNPILKQWSNMIGRTAHTFCGSLEGYRHPLLFLPGTSWGYGAGLDWAGRMIENLTNMSLENFMSRNIWSPLGMTYTTFHPEQNKAKLPPQMDMGLRSKSTSGASSIVRGDVIMKYPLKNDLGGIGLFSTPEDFTKFLVALIDGKYRLLSHQSIETLFQPQLTRESREAMPQRLGIQSSRVLAINNIQDTQQADHCLAGTITLRDIPGRRRKGSANWAGLPNLHWWIDRETGIAATLFTQLMPPGDAGVTNLLLELEEAVYQHITSNLTLQTESYKL